MTLWDPECRTWTCKFQVHTSVFEQVLKRNDNDLQLWTQPKNPSSGKQDQDLRDNADFTPKLKSQVGQAKKESVNFS